MVGALVQEQEGVAAELEEPAALRVGHCQQRGEGRVHHLRDLFRSRPTEAGQSLGHRREPGDVDERERAVDLAPLRLGLVAQPLQRQARDERDELGRWR